MCASPWKYVILFPVILVLFAPNSYAGGEKNRLTTIQRTGKITLITRNNGHCYYTYRGKLMGFEYDLAEAFARYLGVELHVKTAPWGELMEAVDKGKGDFIAASLTITPSRKTMVDFSNSYLPIQHVLRHPEKTGHTVFSVRPGHAPYPILQARQGDNGWWRGVRGFLNRS